MKIFFRAVIAFSLLISMKLFAAQELTLHPGAIRKGFYTGLSTGRLFFTGDDRSLYRDGWVVGFKAGYDIIKYLGAEVLVKFSGHSSTTGTRLVNIPLSFFAYQLIGQVRGSYPITNRLYAELGLGGGLFMSDPNQNRNSSSNRLMFYGEMGFEYFMRSRGISVGLDPSIAVIKDLKSAVIQTTGFLRYTF